jgi:GGDEF domain-containing protein
VIVISAAAIDDILAGADRSGWYKAAMHPSTPRRRHAGPVADAPIDVLLERAEALAKGWLLELLDQQPLARAPAILAADLAGDGPALCAAFVRALGADRELERIAPGGELERLVARTSELAGARTPEEASRAVDALRAVIWSAILSALPDPDGDQVARLAERLTLVSELARGAVLRKLAEAGEPSRVREAPATGLSGALEDAIARSRREGAALSLLLIELEEAERILAVELEQHAGTILDRFASTVRASTRPGDVVVREGPSRAWVIAHGTDRDGALELGSELARAVAGAEPWRGAPLRAAVGTAVLGEHGEDAVGLIEAAEEARFAAAARGIEITRATPEQAGD